MKIGSPFSRRSFLKRSGIAAAMLSYPSLAQSVPASLELSESPLVDRSEIASVCAMCPARCLIKGIAVDGRLEKIIGNSLDPFTGGRICARGSAAVKLLSDPDRLKYPLKRIGKRGEGKWIRITWGEAIDSIAFAIERTLKKQGAKGIGLFVKGPSSSYIKELFAELGIEQIHDPMEEMCGNNIDAAYQMTLGHSWGDRAHLYTEGTECIVLMGSHIGENVQVPQLKSLAGSLSKGVNLVVADPRCSTVAAKADHHLMLRPGTDTALLLGWIRFIIDKGLFSIDHIQKNTSGFDALRHAVEPYTLDSVARICDLSTREIRKTAELIASCAPKVLIHPGRYSSWYGNDVQRYRAMASLNGLLGGMWSGGHSQFETLAPGSEHPAASYFQKGASTSVIRKILAGDIGLIGSWGTNPFQGVSNPYRTVAAYQKAEFTFCCDVLPNEAAMYADIILPEATFLERMDVLERWDTPTCKMVAVRQPMNEPAFDSKDPYWIVQQISNRLGQGRGFNHDDVGQRLDWELQDENSFLKKIIDAGGALVEPKTTDVPLANASGQVKVPVQFFSQELYAKGLPPVAVFEPTPLPPNGFSRLLSGRSPAHWAAVTTNNPWSIHEIAENMLWLNDRIAKLLQINDGDLLLLENQDGIRSVEPVRIKVTPGIRVDCVFLAHGFGSRSPFLHLGFNRGFADSAMLTRSLPDPYTGSRGSRVNFVRFFRDGKALDIPQLDNPPEILRKASKWWFDSFGAYEKGLLRNQHLALSVQAKKSFPA